MQLTNAFIKRLVSYADLAEDEMRLLDAATARSRKVASHRDLIREGDEPDPVFVIIQGWACRYKVLADGSRQILAFMLPGDFCDLHVGSLEKMDHSIGTLTQCQIASISRSEMEKLIVSTPRLTQAFWRSQLVDQGVLRSWLVNMGRRDAFQRLAHLLSELWLRSMTVGLYDGDGIPFPVTQLELADALGMTAIHLNRMLSLLRKRQIINLTGKRLVILDKKELANIAGFDDTYLHRRIADAA